MSVLGIGTDIVAVSRIVALLGRHPERFVRRCFRAGEIPRRGDRTGETMAAAVAGRWAAKEAFLKALGQDVRGIPYRDIEVERAEGAPPRLLLHGRAFEAMSRAGGRMAHVSISHERDFAVATVLIEG